MRANRLVAFNIRKLRVQKGLSQETLAFHSQIDRTYVSRLERGLENPTVAVLERICEAINCDIPTLFIRPAPGERRAAPLKGGPKVYEKG